MQANLMQDPIAAQILQDTEMDHIRDPLAQAAGISPATQNMALAKKKLEDQVKDLTVSVDNQTQLLRTAQEELSEIDQKIGSIQSRIAMAKVNTIKIFFFEI